MINQSILFLKIKFIYMLYFSHPGIALILLTTPIIYMIGSKLKSFQRELLKYKDTRMTVVNEILNGIRVIKMFAWEDSFLDKLLASRNSELNGLRKYAILDGFQRVLWEMIPLLIAISAFLIHTWGYHRQLTSAIGFTSLTLFNLLRGSFNILPDTINNLINAHTSLLRMYAFLQSPEILGIANYSSSQSSEDAGKFNSSRLYSNPGCIDVASGYFSWPIVRDNAHESDIYDNGSGEKINNTRNLSFCSVSCLKSICDVKGATASICDMVSFCRIWWFNYRRNRRSSKRPNNQKYEPLSDVSTHGDRDIDRDIDLVGYKSPHRSPAFKLNHYSQESIYHNKSSPSDEVVINFSSDLNDDSDQEYDAISNASSSSSSSFYNNKIERSINDSLSSTKVILKNVTFRVSHGELAVIVGMTGTGKSTLISGILGECILESGAVGIGISEGRGRGGGVAYAAQSAWIQNATLRDNILFGLPYDEERYKAVLFACALDSDLKIMPGKIHTIINILFFLNKPYPPNYQLLTANC